MKRTFLIRLDDACPTMNHLNWTRMEAILDKYRVRPLVGIIPNNEDPKQKIDVFDTLFWDTVRCWQEKGWEIALHGYSHKYDYNESGLLPFWRKSEFAGAPLEVQKIKIRNGIEVLASHGIRTFIFFAPSHTFDSNTLEALRTESNIRIICDGISHKLYKENGFTFIPQICGRCVSFPLNGVFTFCFHPNIMKEKDFVELENFLKKQQYLFGSFAELDYPNAQGRTRLMKIMHSAYFLIRKIRGLH